MDLMVTPRLQRDSEQMLRLAGHLSLDEDFPIVGIRRLDFSNIDSSVDQLANIWERNGYRTLLKEDNGIEETVFWSFSEAGLKEARRLIARQKRAVLIRRITENWLGIAALFLSGVAAVAVSYSAYFSYLGLQQ